MQRRTFLASSAAAVQAGRIRVGFLGSTHPHGPEKLRQMKESAEWELVGLAEKDPKAAEAASARGVRILTRRELLGDASVQAIAVEGDVGDHAADALEALEAGKHVHLEKAPTADLASFRKAVEIAKRKNLILQMGYMWRYNPAINGALDAARSGALGEVYLVRGSINLAPLTPELRAWIGRFPGGEMFEMAGHLIDPMVRLLGRPSKITPFLQRLNAQDRMPDNTLAVFEWPRALGVILTAGLQPNANLHRTFEILGSKGTAVVRPIEPPTLAIDAAGRKPAAPVVSEYKRYVEDFRDLAAAIRERRKLRFTPEEDLAVHESLLRASGMAG